MVNFKKIAYQEFAEEMELAGFRITIFPILVEEEVFEAPAVWCATTKDVAKVSNYTKYLISLKGNLKDGWYLIPKEVYKSCSAHG